MMLKRQSLNWALGCLLLLLILLLAGCGSTTTSQPAQATQGACPPQSLVRGTIQSVSASSFTITTQSGKSSQVTYTSKTPFLRQSKTTIQAVQVGSIVGVGIIQKNDQTVQATKIELKHLGTVPNGGGTPPGGPVTILQPGSGTPPGTLPPGGPSGLPPGGPGNGTPPAGLPGAPQGGLNLGGLCILTPPDVNAGHPTVDGTVKQVSGNQLTVTDLNHKDHTITITNDTEIISVDAVTPKALQTGMPVAINATHGNKGSLGALLVTILVS